MTQITWVECWIQQTCFHRIFTRWDLTRIIHGNATTVSICSCSSFASHRATGCSPVWWLACQMSYFPCTCSSSLMEQEQLQVHDTRQASHSTSSYKCPASGAGSVCVATSIICATLNCSQGKFDVSSNILQTPHKLKWPYTEVLLVHQFVFLVQSM